MSRATATLFTLAADALRFDDREAAAKHLREAADDLATTSPQLSEDTQTIVDALPRMLPEDIRRAASDCRATANDLAEQS